MIGFGFFGVFFIYLTYYYCVFSQSVKDSVDEIKDIILKSNIGEEDTYVLDGKILRPANAIRNQDAKEKDKIWVRTVSRISWKWLLHSWQISLDFCCS